MHRLRQPSGDQKNGKEVILTPTEYRVLCPLAANAGRVITHNQLLTEVWGWEHRGNTHILKTFVARLRKKIETDPSNPKYITTRPGIGYMFKKAPLGNHTPFSPTIYIAFRRSASAFPLSEVVGNVAQLGEPHAVVLQHMPNESLYHLQPVVPPEF